ncbi:MAG TPA: hypothetical protein VIJ93_09050, partial [bacterium]
FQKLKIEQKTEQGPNMKYKLMVFYFALVLLVLGGCQKTSAPFSADATHPTPGSINVQVLDGSNPAPNVLVNAIDPSGNGFTTVSDSNGLAVFNPLPFNDGGWTIVTPSQNHHCSSPATQVVTIAPGTSSKSATVQYGVTASLSPGTVNISFNSPINMYTLSFLLVFSTQNDCGTPWDINFSIPYPTVNDWGISWSGGSTGLMNSGVNYIYHGATSGQIFSFILNYTPDKTPVFNVSISSPIGSASANNSLAGSWIF